MALIPKVKSVNYSHSIAPNVYEDKLSVPGNCPLGKLPAGGFQSVWNFKNDQPNDYFTRKKSPTSGGGKKVY